jgi:hypothetical protein
MTAAECILAFVAAPLIAFLSTRLIGEMSNNRQLLDALERLGKARGEQ